MASRRIPLIERFNARALPRASGCWEWQGAHFAQGYARMTIERRSVGVHRVAYELFVGPIPCGLEIDHLCRNRGCVNPAHLEPVTHLENMRRGGRGSNNGARVYVLKTHCPAGHPYDERNTLLSQVRADGGRMVRVCRACKRAKRAARYWVQKALRKEG